MNDDGKLREIFKRGIEEAGKDVPDFRPMMDRVVNRSGRRTWFTLGIAAGILIVVAVGISLVVSNQSSTATTQSLTEWSEPTNELTNFSSINGISSISTWSSPTDFLLTTRIQQTKNQGHENN